MKQKIIVFTTAFSPFIGGAEIAAEQVMTRLPQYDFFVFTARLDSKLPAYEKHDNIHIYRVGNGSFLDKFKLIFSGYKQAKKIAPDAKIVWSVMASHGGLAGLRFKKKYPKTKFLLTIQEGDSLGHIYLRALFIWPWFKQIFSKADKVQAISNHLGNWAKKMGAQSEIRIVPNGVVLDDFNISSEETEQLRGKLNLPDKNKLIITVSRLVKKNGVRSLVESMQFLPKDVHLVIIGDGQLKNELIKVSSNLGINNRVHFLGSIAYEDVPKYLSLAGAFCRPSLSEGLGSAFLESMASGVPVVATKVGGIPDFLEDNETGLFCQIENPKDIAEKIGVLLENGDIRDKIIKKGKQVIEDKYSWGGVATQMNKIFNEL